MYPKNHCVITIFATYMCHLAGIQYTPFVETPMSEIREQKLKNFWTFPITDGRMLSTVPEVPD